MPWSIDEGKAMICEYLNEIITDDNMIVLDVGCGQGTYGKLIYQPCYKIGVDALDYYREYALMMIYDKFYQHDIRDTDWLRSIGKVDISIAGDVLEHLSIEDAQAVLGVLQEISEVVIVALPFEWEQKDWNGYEGHIQNDLTPENVTERYSDLNPLAIYCTDKSPWNGRPYYGYYFWKRDKNECSKK